MNKSQQPLYAAYIERLKCGLNNYGATGLIAKLAEYQHDHLHMLIDIQNGCMLDKRDPNESPAEVQEELRAEYRPDFDRIAEMLFVMRLLSDLIDAATNVVRTYEAETR